MYEFYNRLVNVVLPQIRDFRGVSPDAFDGRGNYSIGLTEQLIFPEIDYDRVNDIRGMNITVVTTAPTDEEGRELLKLLGMPFENSSRFADFPVLSVISYQLRRHELLTDN